jgi:hypothetical protein
MGREKRLFKQLQQLLPEGWEEKAKELGAFQRAREIKSPEELLWIILLYLTEGKSLAGTSAITNLAGGVAVSKIAVFKRIQKSGNWLQWMCKNIYQRSGLLTEKPRWLNSRNVILVDGSEDAKCDKNIQYFMLHYSIDLFALDVKELMITNMETGEKLANFRKFEKNDIVVGDRAYGTLAGIAHLKQYGADYVLRLRARAFRIYGGKKQEIDLLERLSGLKEEEYGEIRGYCMIDGNYEPIRICALRKDKDSERKGMKKLEKINQRKRGGKPVSELQEGYNKYIIVVTALGKEISTEQVLELYRARWQIEIAFKRLKSIFSYNEIPARKPENIKTWFYGKLLLAALCKTLVNTGRFSPCGERR